MPAGIVKKAAARTPAASASSGCSKDLSEKVELQTNEYYFFLGVPQT
jgi:hypothetical protein